MAAEMPHSSRLLSEITKPPSPSTKQTVPKVISGRILRAVGDDQPHTAAHHHGRVNRQYHRNHFFRQNRCPLLPAHTGKCRKRKSRRQRRPAGRKGKPQQSAIAQQHRRRPLDRVILSNRGAGALNKQLNKYQRKGGAAGRQPERQVNTVHDQQSADRRPNGPANIEKGG